MKTFKKYLTEHKRTYGFRVKIADYEINSEALDLIKQGLSGYSVISVTKPKRTPVGRCVEFYKLGPVSREIFDAETAYPAIPPQIQQGIHNATGIPLTHIYVVTPEQDTDDDLIVRKSDQPLLLSPLEQEDSDAQNHVGQKRVDSFLKELEKSRGSMTQYKGVNDAVLAKDSPVEGAAKTSSSSPQNTTSPIGTNKSKLQPPRTGSKK
jgi:hypothetical protein